MMIAVAITLADVIKMEETFEQTVERRYKEAEEHLKNLYLEIQKTKKDVDKYAHFLELGKYGEKPKQPKDKPIEKPIKKKGAKGNELF